MVFLHLTSLTSHGVHRSEWPGEATSSRLSLSSPTRLKCTSLLTSSEERALLADHNDLGTHVLASLLNRQIAVFIDVDERDCGMQASTSSDGCDNSTSKYCGKKHF